MPEGLAHLFERRQPGQILTDVLDLLIVTYVVYRALLVLRGTRAMQMGTGLGLIFLVYIAAKWLSLITLLNLLSTLLSSIILIVVVVFQNDIRRGLMRVGSRAFLGGNARAQESRVIDEVVAAATELARHRMGALIAFEQDANLDEFVVGQGIPVDSCVTRELMVSLFVPESVNKLHDGAVIIRNLRIAKAGVFFPMPETRIVDASLGSRHRAALGITDETDAVVVVVSEERGTISFCFSGNIVSNLDGASLRQALLGLFGRKARKKAGKKVPTPARPSAPLIGSRASSTGLATHASTGGTSITDAPAAHSIESTIPSRTTTPAPQPVRIPTPAPSRVPSSSPPPPAAPSTGAPPITRLPTPLPSPATIISATSTAPSTEPMPATTERRVSVPPPSVTPGPTDERSPSKSPDTRAVVIDASKREERREAANDDDDDDEGSGAERAEATVDTGASRNKELPVSPLPGRRSDAG